LALFLTGVTERGLGSRFPSQISFEWSHGDRVRGVPGGVGSVERKGNVSRTLKWIPTRVGGRPVPDMVYAIGEGFISAEEGNAIATSLKKNRVSNNLPMDHVLPKGCSTRRVGTSERNSLTAQSRKPYNKAMLGPSRKTRFHEKSPPIRGTN